MISNPATLGARIEAAHSLTAMDPVTTHRLTNRNQAEVLAFLSKRPLHTAVMFGLISDNGIESNLNRGCFYGWRGSNGRLEGVALIGHLILMEVRSDAALGEFARLAQGLERCHMILGEQDVIARFWELYREGGQPRRHVGRELLWELTDSPR